MILKKTKKNRKKKINNSIYNKFAGNIKQTYNNKLKDKILNYDIYINNCLKNFKKYQNIYDNLTEINNLQKIEIKNLYNLSKKLNLNLLIKNLKINKSKNLAIINILNFSRILNHNKIFINTIKNNLKKKSNYLLNMQLNESIPYKKNGNNYDYNTLFNFVDFNDKIKNDNIFSNSDIPKLYQLLNKQRLELELSFLKEIQLQKLKIDINKQIQSKSKPLDKVKEELMKNESSELLSKSNLKSYLKVQKQEPLLQQQSQVQTKPKLQPQQQQQSQLNIGYDFDGVIHTRMEKDRTPFKNKRNPNSDFKQKIFNNFELFKFHRTIDDMKQEQNKKNNIFIISSNSKYIKDKIYELLKNNGIDIEKKNILMDKYNKSKICKEYNIAKYVDDSWYHIKSIYINYKNGKLPNLKELFYAVPDYYELNQNNDYRKGLYYRIELNKNLESQKNDIKKKLKIYEQQKQSAFIAMKDKNKNKYLVVRDINDKFWMLPGGEVDKPPRPVLDRDVSEVDGALRELKEESGYYYKLFKQDEINTMKLNWIWYQSLYAIYFLYTIDFDFSGIDRKKMFNLRKKGETIDYGFVEKINNEYKVFTYNLQPKKDSNFRTDTIKALNKLFN